MDRSRLIIALALSLVVLISWPILMHYLAPRNIEEPPLIEEPSSPPPPPQSKQQSPGETAKSTAPRAQAAMPVQSQQQTVQVERRDITIHSDYWSATLSNRGAVAKSWILKK